MDVPAEAKSLFSALGILTRNTCKFGQEFLGQGWSLVFPPARVYDMLIPKGFQLVGLVKTLFIGTDFAEEYRRVAGPL